MKRLLLSPLLILLISMSALAQNEPPAVGSMVTQDSTYINTFFNFALSIPKGWSVQGEKSISILSETGKDLVAGDNENLKRALNSSAARTGNLLVAFQHPLGAPVDFNPALVLISENVEAFPGVVTGADYLFHTKAILAQSQAKMDLKEITTTKINGNEFGVMAVDIETPTGVVVKQTYYSTIIKRHCIGIILSYSSDEQHQILQHALISFKRL